MSEVTLSKKAGNADLGLLVSEDDEDVIVCTFWSVAWLGIYTGHKD